MDSQRSGARDLDAQLNDYASAAKSAGKSPDWNARLGRWSIYAAATGAALASATSADASIITGFSGSTVTSVRNCNCAVFTSVLLQTHPPGTTSPNTIAAFSLFAQYFTNAHFRAGGVGAAVATGIPSSKLVHFFLTPPVRTTGGSTYHAKLFAPGIPIFNSGSTSSGAPVRSAFDGTHAGIITHGTLASAVIGTFGFHLANGDLGWIRLQWTSSQLDIFPDTIQALDWAINTTLGEGIIAGQPLAAVPEPGTMPLCLLALGAVGIATWRRSRNQKQAA